MSESNTSPELLASRHLPVTANLMIQDTIIRPVSGTSHRWLKDGMPEVASRDLLLFNWISFCLVHRSVGKTIAASLLTNAGTKSATFLLSTNEPLAEDLLDYSSAFFASLKTVFLRQVERMASGKEVLDDTDIQFVMDVVVTHAPERILRKLDLLTFCGCWAGVGDVKSNLIVYLHYGRPIANPPRRRRPIAHVNR
ncbi:hypothetical protein CPB85DRAFT_1564710 [Mucidula mucida]|nr:hypothetical protein CPB85DRAFT_1564710 [Mucidula mucida]